MLNFVGGISIFSFYHCIQNTPKKAKKKKRLHSAAAVGIKNLSLL